VTDYVLEETAVKYIIKIYSFLTLFCDMVRFNMIIFVTFAVVNKTDSLLCLKYKEKL
jgi:hypothetical protein